MTVPIAFEELLQARVQLAGKELEQRAGENTRLLGENVLPLLQCQLLSFLSFISGQVLKLEFTVFLSRHRSALDRLLQSQANPPSREIYLDFVRQMHSGGFDRILAEYPVLDHLLSQSQAAWVANLAEFLERLKSDLPEINAHFALHEGPGRIVGVQTNWSDRHHQGKSVMGLAFENGLKLVYKPRSLGMEDACFRFLDWLNQQTGQDCFRIVKLLDRGSYGWMEFIPHKPCAGQDEASLFYRRAGALTCVIHCLRGTDCHFENIIANGTYPVLIDMETLFHPDILISRDRSGSVLRTGFLPGFYVLRDGIRYDLCGLGAGSETGMLPKRLEWVNVNTDNMRQEYLERPNLEPRNLPSFGGNIAYMGDYVKEIEKGFREMFTLLEGNKHKLLSGSEPLGAFRGLRSRLVLRHTRFYMELLVKSLEPAHLRSVQQRKNFIRKALEEDWPDILRDSQPPLLLLEQEALENIDIPLLETTVDETMMSPVSQAIENLNPHDLETQSQIIREAM